MPTGGAYTPAERKFRSKRLRSPGVRGRHGCAAISAQQADSTPARLQAGDFFEVPAVQPQPGELRSRIASSAHCRLRMSRQSALVLRRPDFGFPFLRAKPAGWGHERHRAGHAGSRPARGVDRVGPTVGPGTGARLFLLEAGAVRASGDESMGRRRNRPFGRVSSRRTGTHARVHF